jgi:tRNA(fMet)-specific endonuclease VapC
MMVLDTDVCIGLIKRREPELEAAILASEPGSVAISAVTVMELRYGAARRQSPKLTAAVEAFLNGVSILAFDAESAERAGVMRATMEADGHSIALADCQIAATALAYDLTLVTNDGDLKRVLELKVIDWRDTQ